MTFTIVLQAFIVPLIAVFLAALVRHYWPLLIAAAFWGISLWVKGPTLEAMDSVAMAFTLSSVLALTQSVVSRERQRLFAIGQLVLLVLLSVWQVKNFAASLPVISWVIQFAFLLIVWALSTFRRWDESPKAGWQRYELGALFWILPAGYVAILSPIAGSLLVGQISGLIAVFGLLVWGLQGRQQVSSAQLGLLVATPTLFIAQMAWHYVEIPWTSLSLGLLGWLPLLWPGLQRAPWWLKLVLAAVLFGAALAIGLTLEWPEQSLY
ncbi:hypothetical protein [Reinekea blandensis]|uniref:Uncharacterized protein n=1 Tax=Reinekea blandensis MED297 TaxID=314283 RepID=A4BF62_9GAMM|nr:hypothetical protein [Reinekea blandensis]EAR09175.1 hypothetical protein MED297_06828 [Reinekea sp. MED297] [Reinekea blandensis MED297]